MKGIKKYFAMIAVIIMAIAVLPSIPVYASGKVVVAVSASSLNIGDTVTVTATAQGPGGEQTTAMLGFNYDSSKLSFVSCSDSTYSGGGGGYVGVVAEKASITLKATAAGSASVSVSGSDGVIFSSGEEVGELSAGGTTITINNAAGLSDNNEDEVGTNNSAGENNANQSGDNSLASLKISPGTLSPAFKYSTTSYTANVGEDVTEIAVDAKASNGKATVESVTGNTDLKAGANTVSIVVKAENGTTATYKIVVTRGGAAENPEEKEPEETEETGEEDPEAITINGHDFNLAATIPEDKVPEEFTKTTVNCKGQDVEALQFDKGNVILVYLTTPDTEVTNMLAVYDQESGIIYPFVKVTMGNSYYIILNPPAQTELSEMYAATTVELGEYGTVSAYGNQDSELSDFYLLYAISNNGNTGWYQYDKAEGTLQRYIEQEVEGTGEEEANADMKSLQNAYDKLNKQYSKEKSFSRKAMAVLIFLVAVLIIVIVNLLLRGKKEDDEWENDFEKVPKRFSKKIEEKPREEIKEETKEEPKQEKSIPRKKEKVPMDEPLPEEKDDFEVIDLDDL